MPWEYSSRSGSRRTRQRTRTDGYARNYRATRNDRQDYLPEDEDQPDYDDFDDGDYDRGRGRARTGGNRDLFGEELYDRNGERVHFVIASPRDQLPPMARPDEYANVRRRSRF